MRYVATTVAILAGLILAACSASAKLKPGESDYSYGNLRAVESAEYEKVVKATVAAMKELKMKPLVRENDSFRALIVGESVFGALAQSHEVRVHIEWLSDATTQVRRRILGRRDETRLRRLLSEIRKAVGNR